MDWLNIFFFAALIYFFSFLQKRRKSGRAPDERSGESGRPEEPPAQAEQRNPPPPRRTRTEGRPAPASPKESAPGSYDYEAFRKKLRRAWKLDQPETADRNGTPANEARTEAAAPARPDAEPRQPPAAEADAAERARQRRYAEYLRRIPVPEPSADASFRPAVSAAEQTGRAAERPWSEQDVRRWMVYDAVFGDPRSRRQWTPPRGGRK